MAIFDHIVVGAGVSGMTAAILLAREGKRVAVVESFRKPAPTVRGFRRKGMHFDTGVHYVGGIEPGQVLHSYFTHLGIAPLITTTAYHADGFDILVQETTDREYMIPNGYETLTASLCEQFPEEEKAIRAYVRQIRKTFDASPFLNFAQSFSLDNFLHDDTVTLKNYLDCITGNETLKTLLSYQCLLYGVPPSNALFATHALVAGSYCQSAHSIDGGGLALAKAYEQRLDELGVTLFCGSDVESILFSAAGSILGVELENGTRLHSASCVWTAQPSAMAEAVPDGVLRPAYRRRLAALKGTTSGCMLFGVSDIPVPELDRRCRYLWPGGSFEAKLEGDPRAHDNVVYLSSCPDRLSGKTAVTAIFPGTMAPFSRWEQSTYGKRPTEYVNHKEELAAELIQSVQRRCPSLKQVDFMECATPLTLRDYCSTPGGSLYGLKHSNDQYNPAPVTKVDGLYLAGQGIVAPGILGAVVSAYLTCGIILGHDPIHQELRQCA